MVVELEPCAGSKCVCSTVAVQIEQASFRVVQREVANKA